jgi:hypothetical protein
MIMAWALNSDFDDPEHPKHARTHHEQGAYQYL